MYQILMIAYLVVALALIGFILVQQGKGAGMGASFGAGASGTVFGASGSGNFLTKTTTILAIAFFGVALGLGKMTAEQATVATTDDIFSQQEVPATPASTELPAVNNTANQELPSANPAATAQKKAEEKVQEKTDEETKSDEDTKSGDGDNQP